MSEAPQAIQKNAQEVFYDVCKARADYLKISIEKYFDENRADYNKIRELGYSRD